ncbi:MAG: BA14K family protein [Notoacmeibacter sp.]
MTLSLKALSIAAFAAFASFAAPAVVQAQDLFFNDGPLVDGPSYIPVGGFYDDGYRPHHPRLRHHNGNGFSFELQFGQPHVIYQPRHPRPVYQPRPRHVIQIGRAHVQWCYSRYRTYDHRSNSFVIRHGQRAYCVSPYSY